MKTNGRIGVLVAVSLLAAWSEGARAEDMPVLRLENRAPADLTLSNFLSAGWNEPWARRSRGNGTPDLSLLRVQTNFLSRILRNDYVHVDSADTASTRGTDGLTITAQHPFNRRLMLGVVANYRWLDSRAGEDSEGFAGGALLRAQWVDTQSASVATTLRVTLPNRDLGERATAVSLSLSGWQDLSSLGLRRTGIYYHIQGETLAGPLRPGARRGLLTYDLSFAKSWTSPSDFFGNATTFVEFYGTTELDGARQGRTTLTVTPGIRATIARRHVVMAGVDFPLTSPEPFEHAFRLTYISNF